MVRKVHILEAINLMSVEIRILRSEIDGLRKELAKHGYLPFPEPQKKKRFVSEAARANLRKAMQRRISTVVETDYGQDGEHLNGSLALAFGQGASIKS